MKKIYLAPQSEKVVLNVNGDILDNHFGNASGIPVEPTILNLVTEESQVE